MIIFNYQKLEQLEKVLLLLKMIKIAQAGVAQWIELGPANQSVTGSISSHGTCLDCRPGPQ